jgi:tetratricopeptide (TPR) repeat protein
MTPIEAWRATYLWHSGAHRCFKNRLAVGWTALTLLSVLSGEWMVALAQQSAENSYVGKRVITQPGTVLKVGNAVIDDEGFGKAQARGKNHHEFRTYIVEQANGPWLWLVAEGSGVKGWAPAANVIPFDQAINHITRQIGEDPGDWGKYVWRANVWLKQKEVDTAIAEYNEAIRLNPGSAGVAYQGRGIAWRLKKDFDKAIADCNEAIRLDPGHALAYYTRGVVWTDKQDFDKAIADFDEAIRLDPAYARAYTGRGNARRGKKDYDKAIADYNEAIRLNPEFSARAYNGRGKAWTAKKDYDKAIADYSEAIRLDPGFVRAYCNRCVALLLSGSAKLGDDARKVLELEGWRGAYSQYAVLWGYFGLRRAGNADSAKRLLDDAAARCDTTAWPYPVIRYLRGELDQTAMVAAASDNDKMIVARFYLGLDLALKGKTEEAGEQFRWVKEQRNPGLFQFHRALAELDKLEGTGLSGAP